MPPASAIDAIDRVEVGRAARGNGRSMPAALAGRAAALTACKRAIYASIAQPICSTADGERSGEGLTTRLPGSTLTGTAHTTREDRVFACLSGWPGGHLCLSVEESTLRAMLKSKIHRATVTQADLHYEGSITIDAELMDAADILPFEQVHVLDVDNGARLTTYAIEGARGSGQICINGAAARLVSAGHMVIIVAYDTMTDAEARERRPALVYVDGGNRIVRTGHAIAPAAVV
jgi:aspartate 1-decarboxylase